MSLPVTPGNWEVTISMADASAGVVNMFRGSPANAYPRFQLFWNSASPSSFTLNVLEETPVGTIIKVYNGGFRFDNIPINSFLIDLCGGSLVMYTPQKVPIVNFNDVELVQVTTISGSPYPLHLTSSTQPGCNPTNSCCNSCCNPCGCKKKSRCYDSDDCC